MKILYTIVQTILVIAFMPIFVLGCIGVGLTGIAIWALDLIDD